MVLEANQNKEEKKSFNHWNFRNSEFLKLEKQKCIGPAQIFCQGITIDQVQCEVLIGKLQAGEKHQKETGRRGDAVEASKCAT